LAASGWIMARLTRQEAQVRTREHLLGTATEHFLGHGYAAASLEQIAEDAGYSKGAIYSNFVNKDEPCLEVLQRIRFTKMAEIAATITDQLSIEANLTAVQDWAETTIGDQRWTLLELEFAVRSRHSEDIRVAIATAAGNARALIESLIDSLASKFGFVPTISADAAATMLLSVGIGLGLQRALDPRVSVDALTDTLRALVGGTR